MLNHVYLNGDYLMKEDARLHVSDLSILRGYGAFDYFRYIDGKPRFIQDHLDRFVNSAEGLGLELPVGKAELATIVHELIERNGGGGGGIRFVITGGYSEDGYTPGSPNLIALPYSFTPPTAEMYEAGCSVMLHQYERQLPRVKSIDYIEGIRIQPLLKSRGADYPLYVDRANNVRESDRSNFMIVKDGTLITPVEDVLLGITRLHLLRLAKRMGIKTEERTVSVKELHEADEVIICSSTKGAMAITRIDGQLVRGGKPGPVTRRLMESWEAYATS